MSHLKTVSADSHGAKQRSGEKSSPHSPFFCLFHFAGTYFSLKRKVKNGCVCENAADPVFSFVESSSEAQKGKSCSEYEGGFIKPMSIKATKRSPNHPADTLSELRPVSDLLGGPCGREATGWGDSGEKDAALFKKNAPIRDIYTVE